MKLALKLSVWFPMKRRRLLRSSCMAAEVLEFRALLSPLVKGGISYGTIGAKGEVDTWTFNAAIGDRVELISTSAAGGSGFSAFAELYSPSGRRISSFWSNMNIAIDLSEPGSYSVKVRDDDRIQTGNYTIGLEGLKPISPGPVALTKGGIVSGSILTAVEKDQFTFSAKPGDRYEIITTSTARVAGFTAYTEVFAPSGRRISQLWPDTNVILQDFKEDGVYMVQVRDNNYTETGNYTIGLEGLKPISPGPVALTRGGIASGSILTAVEKDQFTFSAKRGDRYEIITTSTARVAGFTAYTEVFAPSGSRISQFWPDTNVVLQDFKEDGVYMVQVRDNNYTETGNYTIGLEGLKPISLGPVALTKGGIVSGSILTAVEKDQFTFSAKPGDRYEIITTSTAIVAGFTAYTEVFAPSGSRISQFWPDTNVVLQDFREDGVYMVQVRDNNYTETGNYTVGLEGLKPISPGARALAPLTTVSASITAATQKDQWTITVPAGKKLSITLSQTKIDSGFDAFADVYSSSGARIGSMWSGTTTFTLPGAGVYLIQIRDSRYLSRGNYKLRAWLV